MKKPLTKIPPVIHGRAPSFGRRVFCLFFISLMAIYRNFSKSSGVQSRIKALSE
jgi:hypothetical protein